MRNLAALSALLRKRKGMSAMPSKKEQPWDRSNPKAKAGKSKKLSPAKKAKAKASAKKAGRPYPNLVDNMKATRAGQS
jgi:hypothetical protein